MRVEIDPRAGFCFGVRKAVMAAEKILTAEGSLYCLGDLVHNEEELNRLHSLGLKTIDHDTFKTLHHCKVLIRAHGEPPETYQVAAENNIELIDATCPVVLKLQDKIEQSYRDIKPHKGQLVIFGKKSHAEVRGLAGQTGYQAVVIEKIADLDRLDYGRPIHLFAQTTMNREDYNEVLQQIALRIQQAGGNPDYFRCTQSICHQVSGRLPLLRKFCDQYDVIIFVSSPKSSNGRVLFDACKQQHARSYFITRPEEVQEEWFLQAESVGVTGATSTPAWLMERVARYVSDLTKK